MEENLSLLFVNRDDQRNPSYEGSGLFTHACKHTAIRTH